MTQFLKNLKESIKIAVIALAITLGATYAFAAWTGPTSVPPDGNVDAPINVGGVDQLKNGALGVNTLAVFGNAGVSGYVQVGTTTAECVDDLDGALRNVDGSGIEYCDSATWQGVSSGRVSGVAVQGAQCDNVGDLAVRVDNETILACLSTAGFNTWTNLFDSSPYYSGQLFNDGVSTVHSGDDCVNTESNVSSAFGVPVTEDGGLTWFCRFPGAGGGGSKQGAPGSPPKQCPSGWLEYKTSDIEGGTELAWTTTEAVNCPANYDPGCSIPESAVHDWDNLGYQACTFTRRDGLGGICWANVREAGCY